MWSLSVRGESVERVSPGDEALVWLGPDKRVDCAVAGRRVWKTSDPAIEKELKARVERDPHRVPLDVRVSGRFGEPLVFESRERPRRRARG